MDLTNPQSLNRYAYVNNNPLNAVDPDGLDCTLTTGAIVFDFEWGPGVDPVAACAGVNGSYEQPVNSATTNANTDPIPFDGLPIDNVPPTTGGGGGGAGATGGAGDGHSSPQNPIFATGVRSLNPSSQECRDLATRISNISRDLEEANNRIMVNPGGLPLFAPGLPPSASVQGHIQIADNLQAALQENVRKYKDKCGGGDPPSVPVRPPVLYLPGTKFPGIPRISISPTVVGVGAAVGIGAAIFLCPECAIAFAF